MKFKCKRDTTHKYGLTLSQNEIVFGMPDNAATDLLNLNGVSIYCEDFDKEAMERAWNAVLEANDALRLRRVGRLHWKQIITPFAEESLPCVCVNGREGFDRLVEKEKKIPIRGSMPALHRAMLVDCGNGEGALLVFVHHLCCDGYGLGLLLKQLDKAYTAEVNGDEYAIEAGSYLRYIERNNKYIKSERFRSDRRWWRAHYRAYNKCVIVARPASDSSAATTKLVLGSELADKLAKFCEQEKCTPEIVIKTAISIAIYRITGAGQFAISDLKHERTGKALKNTVGCIVRTVQLLFDVNPDNSFRQAVRCAATANYGAVKHSNIPVVYTFLYSIGTMLRSRTVYINWFYFSQMDIARLAAESRWDLQAYGEESLGAPFYCAFFPMKRLGDSYLELRYQSAKYTEQQIEEYVRVFLEVIEEGLK